MPAQTTAKMVMASAKRLMELRQPCLKSSRMAEISVPAWPMPIHQTKLMMAKPQATGLRDGPDADALEEQPGDAPPAAWWRRRRPRVNRANQPSGVCGVSTMRAIFSVTDRKVCPGAMTRYSPVAGSTPMVSAVSLLFGRHLDAQPFAGACSTGVSSSSWFGFRTSAT